MEAPLDLSYDFSQKALIIESEIFHPIHPFIP